jgi:hypothetical protein
MKVVVPLAGPDYFRNGFAKGLIPTENGPLLLSTLRSRPWFDATPPGNYSFVLLDDQASRAFAAEHLSLWFPGCAITFLSQPTQGAALSALAGVAAAAHDPQETMIIDLADIVFETDYRPFSSHTPNDVSAIGYAFISDLDCYSYYELSQDGLTVLSAAEKRVISNHASCGVYAFRSAALYLSALSHALLDPGLHTYNGLFYVCPLFNGVVKDGKKAIIELVQGVRDIKTL